jgi:hypothetical protein
MQNDSVCHVHGKHGKHKIPRFFVYCDKYLLLSGKIVSWEILGLACQIYSCRKIISSLTENYFNQIVKSTNDKKPTWELFGSKFYGYSASEYLSASIIIFFFDLTNRSFIIVIFGNLLHVPSWNSPRIMTYAWEIIENAWMAS